jgi:hypothetical protein
MTEGSIEEYQELASTIQQAGGTRLVELIR